jgi:hypothetical protein
VTPSRWLADNLSAMIVAVAQAGATLAGRTAEDNALQADTLPQEGSP